MQVVPSLDDQQQVMLNQPWQAFTAADGNMIVADLDCVHVFSSDGLCVNELKPPHLQGEHWNVDVMCNGLRGKLVAWELEENTEDTFHIQVLDAAVRCCGLFWLPCQSLA